MFIEDFDFRYMMHFLKIVKKRIINKTDKKHIDARPELMYLT